MQPCAITCNRSRVSVISALIVLIWILVLWSIIHAPSFRKQQWTNCSKHYPSTARQEGLAWSGRGCKGNFHTQVWLGPGPGGDGEVGVGKGGGVCVCALWGGGWGRSHMAVLPFPGLLDHIKHRSASRSHHIHPLACFLLIFIGSSSTCHRMPSVQGGVVSDPS